MKILNLLQTTLLVLFTFCVGQMWGQNFSLSLTNKMQSARVMEVGTYTGTVYEPFSSTTPSEQNYSPAQAPSGPRRTKIDPGDETDEEQAGWTDKADYGGTDLSPIGEPWIMALFALLFAGMIAIRQYKRETIKSMNMKKATKFIATLGLLLTLGVGNAWGWTWTDGKYIYFDNGTMQWSKVYLTIKDGSNNEKKTIEMTRLGNTNFYYTNEGYKDYGKLAFRASNSNWTNYSADYTNDVNSDVVFQLTSNGGATSQQWGGEVARLGTSGKTIYFWNNAVTSTYFTTVNFRYGMGYWSQAPEMERKPGTQQLYYYELPNDIAYYAYYIANKPGWTNANTIYQPADYQNWKSGEGNQSDGNKITQQLTSEKTDISGDVYITPTSASEDAPWGGFCYWYNYSKSSTSGCSVSFSPSHGTITVEKYLNDAGTSTEAISSGDAVLPTQIISVSTTPDTGYKLSGTIGATNATNISSGVYYVTGACTVSATFAAKQCAITLNYETGKAGYYSSGSISNAASLTATYDAAMTALTGTMPSAKPGYKFMGFYTDHDGAGTKYYNADGSSANNWAVSTESTTTLYAYYQIVDPVLTLAAVTVGTEESDSATVSITPNTGTPAFNEIGTVGFCPTVYVKNGSALDPQPEGRSFSEGGVLKYRFASPRISGTFTLTIAVKANNDCGATPIVTRSTDFIVSGDHTVTIRHMCGSVAIHEPTKVTIHPGETESITAFSDEDVFGYKFDEWDLGAGTGVSTENDTEERTINISAIFDGTITAKYTRRNLIYFKNTLGWSDVYIHFLGSSYWNKTQGCGNSERVGRNKHMTRIGETDVWYYDYETADITPSGYEVFTDREFIGTQTPTPLGYGNFHGTSSSDPAKVVYPAAYDDPNDANDHREYGFYSSGGHMFVPLNESEQTYVQKTVSSDANKIAYYYNKGYWRDYDPNTKNTGYTIKVYNKQNSDGRTELRSKTMTDGSDGILFESKVDLEAGQTYGVKFIIGSDMYFTNASATMTGSEDWDDFEHHVENYAAAALTTTVAGEYTFRIICSGDDGKMKMSVAYPASTNDYRVVYKDTTTWTPANGKHGASWGHPSRVITKNAGAIDTISFFVYKDKQPQYKFEYLKSLSPVTWAGGSLISVPDSIQKKGTGVYNFILKQEKIEGKDSIHVIKIEPYTGSFYIRTDNAGSTKWTDYQASDHLMTYSEYAQKSGYTHYYMKFADISKESGKYKNVKFCIANDYSPCVSDTLKQTASDATNGHATTEGDLDASANVRFMWNSKTNTLNRAYLAEGGTNGSYFLVLKGENSDKLQDTEGRQFSSANGNNRGVGTDEVQFNDNQDWIYEVDVKALPGGRIKLYAMYDDEYHYFYGTSDASFTGDNGVELIGGSGAMEQIRVIYDFKTNRLMAAWVPSGDVSSDKTIEADIMLVREQQNGGGQIHLTNSATLTTSTGKTIYGVMKFNRWDLNNLSRTNTGTVDVPVHAPLSVGDQKSAYERFNYFISFPFDVKVSEIFGFGTIGRHYRLYFYDGIGRAQEGFFAERTSNWKMIDDTDSTLHAYQGYLLQLNSVRMATNKTDVWADKNQDWVELYFPAAKAISSITIDNETIPALALDGPYKCNKDLSAVHGGNTDADRRNKDSYWRCIGTPSFANYGATFSSWEDGTGFHYTINEEKVPYLYEWETTTNKLIAVRSSTFTFKSMHAYLIQNPNEIIWSNVSKPTYSAIVARKQEAPTNYEWKLTMSKDENLLDQTFVRMTNEEEVTADFDFGQDLIKEWNETANIYTKVGYEQVAANSMPLDWNTKKVVPVGVKLTETGDYTFSIPEGTNGIGVTLIDRETGISTNLGLMDYTINLTAGTFDERFLLEISPIQNAPTGIDEVQSDDVQGTKARKMLIDGALYIIRDGKMFDARGARIQ